MARAVFGNNSRTSNPNPSGIAQGTFGGRKTAGGARPGMKLMLGDEKYLWLLLILELLAMGALRQHFRRYHGG